MNTRIIALACALTATGCGSSSTRPAQDATSGTTVTVTPPSITEHAAQPASPRTSSAAPSTATNGKSDPDASPEAASKPVTPTIDANPGATDQTKSAENTKTNTRDRQNALTPMDQGNSAAETKTTANIRKGIMGSEAISFTGKNVKIVTIGTKVTLRGPVKSARERVAIEDIAKRTAGVSDVDNQLEVSN